MKIKGKIIAIANYKGGTGKTTCTVNIASSLAIKGFTVLVVDGDPQSDSTRALLARNIDIDNSLYDLIDPEEESRPAVTECIYPTIHENLSILPNITETSGLEIPLAKEFPKSNFYMRDAIRDYTKENYDFILIDCPPTLSMFVANALYAADCVIIPMDAGSANSVEGVKGVIDLMNAVTETGNPELKTSFKLMTNKVDRRKTAHKVNIATAMERFGVDHFFKQAVPTSSNFEAAETMRKSSIFTVASTSKGATAFRALALECIEYSKSVG